MPALDEVKLSQEQQVQLVTQANKWLEAITEETSGTPKFFRLLDQGHVLAAGLQRLDCLFLKCFDRYQYGLLMGAFHYEGL